jgi:hypothetical protein
MRTYPQHRKHLLKFSTLDRKLDGQQSRSESRGEEKKSSHCTCREMNPGLPACSVVTILTELLLHTLEVKVVSVLKYV